MDYWQTKVGRNRSRDIETTAVLEEHGWLVLRFWEHEVPADVADVIETAVSERRVRIIR